MIGAFSFFSHYQKNALRRLSGRFFDLGQLGAFFPLKDL